MARQAFTCTWLPDKQLYRKRLTRKSGKPWDIYAPTKAALKDKVEAAQKIIDAELEVTSNPTVADYCKKWFDLTTGDQSESHIESKRNVINTHICPIIGALKLREVKPSDCAEVLAALKGKSQSLQHKVVWVMQQVFGMAEDNDLIVKSPCRKLKAGGVPAAEKEALTDAQCAVLIAAVAGTRVHSFVMIARYAGLRREEILGLRWEAVHLDADTPYLSVRRTVTYPTNCRPVISEELKSKAARRDIPLPPALVAHLKQARGDDENRQGYIFATSDGDPWSYSMFRNAWGMVKARTVRDGQKYGSSPAKHPDVKRTITFDVTPHLLRHTYITDLIMSGTNIKVVQYLAGHADIQITLNIYTHITGRKPEELLKHIGGAFGADENMGI